MSEAIEEVLLEAESGMDSAIDALKVEMSRIRTGRAHSGMLDHVRVDYYGAPTPLRSLAGVSVQEGRTLVVQPFDKTSLRAIEQGLAQGSGLDVPIQNDGIVIRMTLPELTGETRKALVKEMRKKGEDGKVRVRNVRRDANEGAKKLEKDKTITEDDLKRLLEQIQKLTDDYVEKVEAIMDAKEKDILNI